MKNPNIVYKPLIKVTFFWDKAEPEQKNKEFTSVRAAKAAIKKYAKTYKTQELASSACGFYIKLGYTNEDIYLEDVTGFQIGKLISKAQVIKAEKAGITHEHRHISAEMQDGQKAVQFPNGVVDLPGTRSCVLNTKLEVAGDHESLDAIFARFEQMKSYKLVPVKKEKTSKR